MFRPWQRFLGCLAACGLGVLLAGCEISGTVEVRSETEVVANLVVTEADADCLGLTEFAGLAVRGTPDPDGNQRCRAQGTVDLGVLTAYGVTVSQHGEYLMVDVALPRRIRDMPISVDITFPGLVVDAGPATTAGNQVTLTEGVGVSNFSRTRVVALSHPGPPWWVTGLAGGFVVGVGFSLALLLVLRRRRLMLSRVTDDGSPLPDDSSPSPSPNRDRDRTSSPPAGDAAAYGQAATGFPAPATPAPTVRDADYEAQFAPPAAGPAPPATPDPSPPSPAPGPEQTTDHRIWAPPGDLGDR